MWELIRAFVKSVRLLKFAVSVRCSYVVVAGGVVNFALIAEEKGASYFARLSGATKSTIDTLKHIYYNHLRLQLGSLNLRL